MQKQKAEKTVKRWSRQWVAQKADSLKDEMAIVVVAFGALYLSPALVNPAWKPLAPNWHLLAIGLLIIAWAVIKELGDRPDKTDKTPREQHKILIRRLRTALLLGIIGGAFPEKFGQVVQRWLESLGP